MNLIYACDLFERVEKQLDVITSKYSDPISGTVVFLGLMFIMFMAVKGFASK